jgi:hypothetical protein
MPGWVFSNWTGGVRGIPIESSDHAVDLLARHAGRELGTCLDFIHTTRGLIACVARDDGSTVSFDPGYDPAAHRFQARRNAFSVRPVVREPYCFVDSVGVLSTIPVRYVLPNTKVEKALRYIIAHHDFPNFVRWSEPIGGEE